MGILGSSLPASNAQVTANITHLGDALSSRCLLPWLRCTTLGGADESRSIGKEVVLVKRSVLLLTVAAVMASMASPVWAVLLKGAEWHMDDTDGQMLDWSG